MAQIFHIEDNTVLISSLTLSATQGLVTHTGNYSITGNVSVANDATIGGTLNVETLKVKNLIADNNSTDLGSWVSAVDSELNGKGFSWSHATGQTQLIYRSGGRLWANANLDIGSSNTYNINNIPVISATALGGTITKSNLTSLGTLNKLSVAGDATLGDFMFINSTFNRLGIGIEEPNFTIDILDNNVNIVIGSPNSGIAHFGTNSNDDIAIISDGLERITVTKGGEVNIGNPVNGGAVLNVYGTLNATSVVTDSRIDRTHALQFLATKDNSIYGLGLVWLGAGAPRQLIMSNSPDRLHSTESFDISAGKFYYIDSRPVLSSTTLGDGITNSNLTTLGTLKNLSVDGTSTLNDLIVNQITISEGIKLVQNGIDSQNQIKLTSQSSEVLYGDINEINIGDKLIQAKPVKVFGPLSVNINNPDPTLQFSVNGDVSLGGRRFTSGRSAPTSGIFNIGDMCWNSEPKASSYVGWVCIIPGTPGQWLGFGMISNQ